MSYIYDAQTDSLYVRLRGTEVARQVKTGDGVIIDVDCNDTIVGVDVMVPSDGWDAEAIVVRWKLGQADANLLRLLSKQRWNPEADGRQIEPSANVGSRTDVLT